MVQKKQFDGVHDVTCPVLPWHRMFRMVPLLLGSVLLFLPGRAFLLEPPAEHEEWQGSIGALWVHYPLRCSVWGDEEKRIFQCAQEGNTVDLTVHHSLSDPLLQAQGTILGKTVDARAAKKGETLTVSGNYDGQTSSIPITIGGTAEDFTFHGTYDQTPFQGKGSYKPDSLHVSLSFTKTIPITGTLDLRRSDGIASSAALPVEPSSATETGTMLTGTGILPATGASAASFPTLPLLSSGAIEGASRQVVERVQESGRAIAGFSRILSLVLQAIFALLVIALLITFVFLLRHLKTQQRGQQSKDHPPPH